MTNQRIGDWIQVASGGRFWPMDPRPSEVNIEDIAHTLSNQCRFSGHVSEFYSVAQHSVLVSLWCDPADALWGLLHDASEAYLIDVPRPIKRLPEMQAYRAAEDAVMECVRERFGLGQYMPASVHAADEKALATEARDLMSPLDPGWSYWLDDIDADPTRIHPVAPDVARRAFLARWDELTKGRPS
jgi:hypothetical protein